MKICSTCKLEKTIDKFAKRKDRSSGVVSRCKDCVKEEHKTNYMSYLVTATKHRAESHNLDFNLDKEYLESIKVDVCPIFNTKLIYCGNITDKRDNSASLDRIDNSKGYVKGNVWFISNKANRCKSNLTFEELEQLYFKLKEMLECL